MSASSAPYSTVANVTVVALTRVAVTPVRYETALKASSMS